MPQPDRTTPVAAAATPVNPGPAAAASRTTPVAAAKPDDPGGGEDTDTVGNNLSMPVLFSEDGYALTLQGTMDAPLITTVVQSTIEGETCFGAPQKTTGNLWQADNLLVPGNAVTLVDWGDALESTDARQHAAGGDESLRRRWPG